MRIPLRIKWHWQQKFSIACPDRNASFCLLTSPLCTNLTAFSCLERVQIRSYPMRRHWNMSIGIYHLCLNRFSGDRLFYAFYVRITALPMAKTITLVIASAIPRFGMFPMPNLFYQRYHRGDLWSASTPDLRVRFSQFC